MAVIYYDTNSGGLSNVELDLNFRTTNWINGAEATASGTVTLPSSGNGANYFVVAGSTTITGITDVQNGDTGVYGYMCRLKFSGTPQLTHGAGFQLMFGANMTMAVGDVATFVNESNGVWRMVAYMPASTLGDIVAGDVAADSYSTGTILSTVEGITQSSNDNSTKIATTAYADNAAGNSDIFVNESNGKPMMANADGYYVTNNTEDTWYTYGAISSGADKESAFFNDVTTDHDWVELKILAEMTEATTGSYGFGLAAGDDTATGSISDFDWYIAYDRNVTGSTETQQITRTYTHRVPVGNGMFSMRWVNQNSTDTLHIRVWVIGVGVNGS